MSNASSPAFERYIGIDYSGAETPTSSLKGLRIFMADRASPPLEVEPPASPRKYWTRRGVAEWLVERLSANEPSLVGIDHGFSFPLRYFERHLLALDWASFLDDFQRHWPTDDDHTYVDSVRHGEHGSGAARSGDSRWRRRTEMRAGAAKSVFHFDVPGSVAKSTHAGLPWLRYLRNTLGNRVHFWPFEGWDIPVGVSAIVEVYPALWSRGFARENRTPDQHDAWSVAAWLRGADMNGSLTDFLKPSLTHEDRTAAQIEGWILGIRWECDESGEEILTKGEATLGGHPLMTPESPLRDISRKTSEMRIGTEKPLDSIETFITEVRSHWSSWGGEDIPWFRGQRHDWFLRPKLFREERPRNYEDDLIQFFRLKARTLGPTPHRDHIDEWLFLMQHSGLPTRALDWTEGALIALFFAVSELPKEEEEPVVWILNPRKLNDMWFHKEDSFPLGWVHSQRHEPMHRHEYESEGQDINVPDARRIENIKRAFGGSKTKYGRDIPEAIYPTYVHIRMNVQRSCFTIHGKKEEGMERIFEDTLVEKGFLRKLKIMPGSAKSIRNDLMKMGISHATLFPEFDHLAKELETLAMEWGHGS